MSAGCGAPAGGRLPAVAANRFRLSVLARGAYSAADGVRPGARCLAPTDVKVVYFNASRSRPAVRPSL